MKIADAFVSSYTLKMVWVEHLTYLEKTNEIGKTFCQAKNIYINLKGSFSEMQTACAHKSSVLSLLKFKKVSC